MTLNTVRFSSILVTMANITFIGSFFTEPEVGYSLLMATGFLLVGALACVFAND
jgi:hypothetical protein